MVRAKSIAKSRAKYPKAHPGNAPVRSAIVIQPELHIMAVELRCALSGITVAVRALREQNADIDSDVAVVLQKTAGGPLHSALQKLESLLGAPDAASPTDRRSSTAGRMH